MNTATLEFVIDNTVDGFDLHNLETGTYVRTFKTGDITRREPKQVAFIEDARAVVGGSDHGNIYIFDRRSGVQSQKLQHGTGMVQTIAVCVYF
jgi:hypothetical protein